MQFIIDLDREYVEALVDLTGYHFNDIDDVMDEDIEDMIMDLIDNV